MTLVTFSFPEMTLSRNSVDSAYENAELAEIFRLSINSKDFCQTKRPVTILILET